MGDISNSMNVISEFIGNYRKQFKLNNGINRISYTDFQPPNFSSFKGNDKYKEYYQSIFSFIDKSALLNKEISVNNLPHILVLLFKSADKDKINDSSYLLLTDLINKIEIGGIIISDEDISSLNSIKNELLHKFINKLDVNVSSGTTISTQITTQQQHHDVQITRIPDKQPVKRLLASTAKLVQTPVLKSHQPQDSINISLKDLESLILKIAMEAKNSDKSVLQNTTNINTKTLSRNALTDITQSIFIRNEKIFKIEKTIAIFQSHKDNKTVPNALSFLKFPKPFWADDTIFVNEHNNIIRNAQMQIIDSIIDRGRNLVECLHTELREIRSRQEVTNDGNKDLFFDNIKASVTNNLKPFFKVSNSKFLTLKSNYYEDRINTEYEIQENVSDKNTNNYLQINDSSDNNKASSSSIYIGDKTIKKKRQVNTALIILHVFLT